VAQVNMKLSTSPLCVILVINLFVPKQKILAFVMIRVNLHWHIFGLKDQNRSKSLIENRSNRSREGATAERVYVNVMKIN